MGLFGKKEHIDGLLGVDIGAGGIKLAELQKKDSRLHLTTYGYSRRKATMDGSLLDDPALAGRVLKELHKRSGAKVNAVNVSLPSHEIFHAIITIPQPKSPEDQLKHMIEGRVAKLLPLPMNEMVLDSTIIDRHLLPKEGLFKKSEKKKDKKGEKVKKGKDDAYIPLADDDARKHIRVLVLGTPKTLVKKYVDTFKAAGLELASLESEAFALIRSLIGNDKSHIMIVDIGHERTNIAVTHEGIPFLHRSIRAGGGEITSRLSKAMNISLEEAEQYKLDLALGGTQGEMPAVLKDVIDPILHEIRYSLSLYDQQNAGKESIEKIILTGGSAQLPYLVSAISKDVDKNVYLGNPWARVVVPSGLKPALEDIGPRFAVAVGLGMKQKKKES